MLHYVKLLPWLEEYARKAGARSDDWAQEIFDDLTEHGRVVSIYELPPNEGGPRIALCGDRFFAEGGIDKDRADAVFISHLNSATQRPARKVPSRCEAEFVLARYAGLPALRGSSVRPLFGLPIGPPPGSQASASTPDEIPTKRLRERLRQAPAAIRKSWLPRIDEARAGLEVLTRYRAGWSSSGLSRFRRVLRLGPRLEATLDGDRTPQQLSAEELSGLASGFGVRLLNEATIELQRNPDALWAVLDSVGQLPLDQGRRAHIWGEMAAGQQGDDLRQDLLASGDALRAMDSDARAHWDRALAFALSEVARQRGDRSLERLIDEAAVLVDPLEAILQWAASGLVAPAESTAVPPRPEPEVETAPVPSAAPHAVRAEPTPSSSHDNPEPDRTVPTPPEPEPERGSPSPTDKPEDRWLRMVVLGDPELPLKLGDAIAGLSRRLSTAHGRSRATVDDLPELLAVLGEARATANEWLDERLKSLDKVQEELAQARSVVDRARHVLGDQLGEILERGPSQSELGEIVELLEFGPTLDLLPAWLWGGSREEGLLDARTRRRARQVAETFTILGASAARLVASVQPPPEGQDLDTYLERELAAAEQLKPILKMTDEVTATWVSSLISQGASIDEVLASAQVVTSLSHRLPAELFLSILGRLRDQPSPAEARDLAQRYERALDEVEAFFKSTAGVTFDQLDARARVAVAPAEAGNNAHYSVMHDHVGTAGQAFQVAPLIFESTGGEFGLVRIPLVICSPRNRDVTFRLQLAAEPPERAGWPQERGGPEASQDRVRPSDWRGPEDGEYRFPITWTVPLRRPAGGKLRLHVALVDQETNEVLARGKQLEWEVVPGSDVAFNWPAAVDVEQVTAHPIGPQKHAGTLWQRLRARSSFAVLAPRRFGKTTLVQHLAERSGQDGVLTIGPVNCLAHQDEAGAYPSAFWDEVAGQCQAALKVTMRKGPAGMLPSGEAFHDIKVAAAAHGYRTVALLLDEAQAFFPRRDQDVFRTRLKQLLELEWMVPSSPEGAALVIGMVGLRSLRERAAGDVGGVLQPLESSDIEPDDLNRLILHHTHLRTTRAARVELARQSRNLYILRTLLERLIDRVNKESRCWANVVDVQTVSGRLREALENGEEAGVADYLRDALNDAETVNDWEPNAALPVAIALAVEAAKGARLEQEAFQRCRRLLEAWCLEASEGLVQLAMPELRFREHLRTLAERDVFASGAFRSDLLAAWLRGEHRSGFSGFSHPGVVLKSATLHVQRPRKLEAQQLEGGEARLFTFEESGCRYALREARLPTTEQQDRFRQSAEALRRLTTERFRNARGAQYVLQLREIGISAEDEMLGLMIYRWIDGADLQASLGSLPAVLVADLGVRVALALQLLHDNNILHRDVRPRNIILAEDEDAPAGFRPVLIDFGLARLEGREMRTQVGPEFSAPEVQGSKPQWSRAADVFALGRVLDALLAPDDPQGDRVRAVTRRMTAARSDDRLTAGEANAELRELDKHLKLSERLREAWGEIQTLCGSDLDEPRFGPILNKFRSTFEGLVLGHHRNAYEQCADLANFANQVLEAFGMKGLGWAYNNAESALSFRSEISTLLRLRNYRVHGGDGLSRELRRPERDVVAHTRAGLTAIGDVLNVPALGRIAQRFAVEPAAGRRS